ncbi:hypothetical protein NDU88_003173 [Pleurodeles waltl]|uniref:Uncharacterized protein n=1 Tax=Pleurodeles waltl TaxID=8319 RepID=A0AAV7V1N2_PLEWA|nr:hypothetical protein NDU88_003173 [Pleurodeles waltl]
MTAPPQQLRPPARVHGGTRRPPPRGRDITLLSPHSSHLFRGGGQRHPQVSAQQQQGHAHAAYARSASIDSPSPATTHPVHRSPQGCRPQGDSCPSGTLGPPRSGRRYAPGALVSAPSSWFYRQRHPLLRNAGAILNRGHSSCNTPVGFSGLLGSPDYRFFMFTECSSCGNVPVLAIIGQGYRITSDRRRLPGAPLEACCSIGVRPHTPRFC